jgi:hypothetical protein
MDGFKAAVARVVQTEVDAMAPALAKALGIDESDIAMQDVDTLNTTIRLKTRQGMPRYFNVKVSELL